MSYTPTPIVFSPPDTLLAAMTKVNINLTNLQSALSTLESGLITLQNFNVGAYLPSEGQKAALVGTNGTPGSANKYVTDQDTRLSDLRAPTAHGSTAHTGNIGTEAQVTFSTSSGHLHNGTDSRQVDHTSLANKGTNTHAQLDTHLSATAPHSGHETTTNKGQVNGYASLGSDGKIPTSQLPSSDPNSVPTGTGFRHITAGVEDAAAVTVVNADVAAGAAIAESKLALNYATHASTNDPSSDQKAAMAGTSGTPADGNRYVTNGDSRLTDARTPSSHGSTVHSGTIGTESQITFASTGGHAHTGTGSTVIDHVNLTNKGTNTHAQIDTAVSASGTHIATAAPHSGHEVTSAKGAASGYASLNASSTVVQNPANATATATASKIPIADGSGKLDTWVSSATSSVLGLVKVTGQLGGTAASPTVVGVTESGGQALTMGAIADGQLVKRSGTTVAGTDLYDDIRITISGGGSAITSGAKAGLFTQINYACTIVGWTVLGNEASGSIVLDIFKNTYAVDSLPSTSITASAKPTVSSARNATSTTLTGWTTAVSAGDVIKINVDSCTTFTAVVLILKVRRAA